MSLFYFVLLEYSPLRSSHICPSIHFLTNSENRRVVRPSIILNIRQHPLLPSTSKKANVAISGRNNRHTVCVCVCVWRDTFTTLQEDERTFLGDWTWLEVRRIIHINVFFLIMSGWKIYLCWVIGDMMLNSYVWGQNNSCISLMFSEQPENKDLWWSLK